jgi:uncharacterized iron-regulated membrane protein
MGRAATLYWIAVAALLALLVEVVSGFVLWIALPRGDGFRFRGSGSRLAHDSFGFDRPTWLDIHDWAGIALVVILLLHLVLHWRWVVTVTRRLLAGDV